MDRTMASVDGSRMTGPLGHANSLSKAKMSTFQPASLLSTIQALFIEKGHLQYGEDVTQLQHALQCAHQAEQAGASDALVVAALLHDMGHMVHRDAALAVQQGQDDHHEALGSRWLARGFDQTVTEPIRLHVQAKRYLCAREPAYAAALSPLSKTTLQLQGGPMSEEEALRFEAQPYAMDAVRLRRWDDHGKAAQASTPTLQHFLTLAARLVGR